MSRSNLSTVLVLLDFHAIILESGSNRSTALFLQGFDIARTEVGLENEIQKDLKRKPPEPYRRRPDGSTELEGMYSPGETPPPKQPLRGNTPPEKVREDGEGEEGLVAPHSGQKVKGQRQTEGGGRPLPPALETLHPPKKLPK